MAPVSSVYRINSYGNCFNAARNFSESLRNARYSDAAAPAENGTGNLYSRLTGIDPLTRANYIREIEANPKLDSATKSYWIGLLYSTYKSSAERMNELAASARAFVGAMPAKLEALKTRLNRASLNAYTSLGNLGWEGFKKVFIETARTAADSLHVKMPRLFVNWDSQSNEIASYDSNKNELLINLKHVDSVKDLERATLHEMTHAEQKKKVETASEGDGDAAMLALNQKLYFSGGLFYRSNPAEQEAFETMNAVDRAFQAAA